MGHGDDDQFDAIFEDAGVAGERGGFGLGDGHAGSFICSFMGPFRALSGPFRALSGPFRALSGVCAVSAGWAAGRVLCFLRGGMLTMP